MVREVVVVCCLVKKKRACARHPRGRSFGSWENESEKRGLDGNKLQQDIDDVIIQTPSFPFEEWTNDIASFGKVNGKHIFNVHWTNSLGLMEGFCTVREPGISPRFSFRRFNRCGLATSEQA